MVNESKETFLEVAEQGGELLLDYFNNESTSQCQITKRHYFVPILKELYLNRKRTKHL